MAPQLRYILKKNNYINFIVTFHFLIINWFELKIYLYNEYLFKYTFKNQINTSQRIYLPSIRTYGGAIHKTFSGGATVISSISSICDFVNLPVKINNQNQYILL